MDSKIRQYSETNITNLVQVPSFRGAGENPVAMMSLLKRASCAAASRRKLEGQGQELKALYVRQLRSSIEWKYGSRPA